MEGKTAVIIRVEGDQLSCSSLLICRGYHTEALREADLLEVIDHHHFLCDRISVWQLTGDVSHWTPEHWVHKVLLFKENTFIVELSFIIEWEDAFVLLGKQV